MSWSPLTNNRGGQQATTFIRRPVCPCCGQVMCVQTTRRVVIQDMGAAAMARVRSYRCKVHKQTVKVVIV